MLSMREGRQKQDKPVKHAKDRPRELETPQRNSKGGEMSDGGEESGTRWAESAGVVVPEDRQPGAP